MTRLIRQSIAMLALLTLVTGIAYPLANGPFGPRRSERRGSIPSAVVALVPMDPAPTWR